MFRVDDQVTDSPSLVVHEDVLNVANLSVLGPNGVAYDRGRSLEVTAATVSGTDQTLGQGFVRLSRVD
jgi:hypothetical protein